MAVSFSGTVHWVEAHPIESAVIGGGSVLVLMWLLGFFGHGSSGASAGASNLASAYYAAEAQQAVVGGQIQQANIAATASTAQANINANAAVAINAANTGAAMTINGQNTSSAATINQAQIDGANYIAGLSYGSADYIAAQQAGVAIHQSSDQLQATFSNNATHAADTASNNAMAVQINQNGLNAGLLTAAGNRILSLEMAGIPASDTQWTDLVGGGVGHAISTTSGPISADYLASIGWNAQQIQNTINSRVPGLG